ncbi:lysozyme P-like [Drosophila sulfurigaster albostrigata]|uniref:lysozyme P-like n=1 Tax=Drosophila sulfurigaster albostrigata TaxID=89887 RepID=UPI002D21D89F|nr:lysozyme P-like [Drosophila sulfurigaster albostrigata]
MEKTVLLFVLFLVRTVQSDRTLDRCTLAIEMDRLGVPREDLAAWVYIANHESGFQTNVISIQVDGSKSYGLFLLSSKNWCTESDDSASDNFCNESCDNLLSDQIKASVRCALVAKGRAGWTPWPIYRDFQLNRLTSVEDCFQPEIINCITNGTVTDAMIDATEHEVYGAFYDYKPEFEFQ